MDNSRQTTTKIASPDATIISDSRYLLIAKQLRGHLISAAFLEDSVGRAWPDAAELSHPVSEVPLTWWGRRLKACPTSAYSGLQTPRFTAKAASDIHFCP
jgi:hypothetical protein